MERGKEGTTPRGWTANDLFGNLMTAGQLETMLQVGQAQGQASNYAQDAGIANSAVVVLDPQVTTPQVGMPLRVRIAYDNTGATTINYGAGVVPLVRANGSACIGGELKSTVVADMIVRSGDVQLTGIAPATAAAIVAGTDTQSAVTPSQLVSAIPSGSVSAYAGATAPTSWMLCYGQAISRTTYSALYAVIGVVYGVGDGSTTFNVPDLRGRFIAAADNMGGVAANRLGSGATGGITGSAVPGAVGGEQSHAQTVAELAAHTHPIPPDPNVGALQNSYNAGAGVSGGGNAMQSTGYTTTVTSSTGSGTAFNVTPPALVMNYIIKI